MKTGYVAIALVTLFSQSVLADTPVDVTKLKATNVYSMLPQQTIFVELQRPTPKVVTVPGDAAAVALLPIFLITDVLVNSVVSSSVFHARQADTSQLREVLDKYPVEPVIGPAVTDAIRSYDWLHPVKDVWSPDESSSHVRLRVFNPDVDSILTTELSYSISPDYRGLIILATLKLYSSALSPQKYDRYDPDSAFAWLKQPVAIRNCIYQSKLLMFPEKTDAVIAQLSGAADREFDSDNLKKDVAELNRDPYSLSLSKRTDVISRMNRYTALLQAIHKPQWGDLDSYLMSRIMWSENDGALYKQAVQDGAAALKDLIAAGILPVPAGATPVPKAAGQRTSFFVVKETSDRKIVVADSGIAVSLASGDPIDIGSPLTP